MYQNQQLPFPADRLIAQFLSIGFNNPPYVPQNYDGPPGMYPMVPVVAVAAAMEIQNQANTGKPLRIFMYNQMCVNNYANQEYDTLVRMILDHILLEVRRTNQQPDMFLQNSVAVICELWCANNVALYPQLQQYIDQQTFSFVTASVNEFRNVTQYISNMRLEMRAGSYQQPMQQGRGFNTNIPVVGQNTGNLGMFGTQQTISPVASRGNLTGGKYSSDVVVPRQNTQFQPQQQTIVQSNAVGTEQMSSENSGTHNVFAKDCKLKWKPIDVNNHYYLAHNPLYEDLCYTIKGNTIIDIFRRPKEIENMDPDRHKLTTVFGQAPRDYKFSNVADLMSLQQEAASNLNEVVEKLDGDLVVTNDPEINLVIDNKLHCEDSLDGIWTSVLSQRLFNAWSDSNTAPALVFRSYGSVVKTIIGDVGNDSETLKKYGAIRTYSELAKYMNDSLNSVGIEFWSYCNDKMTRLINRILHEELSLPGMKIDSFVQDIDDLIALINTRYGAFIKDSFLKNQHQYIASVMVNSIPETAIDDGDDDTTKLLQPFTTHMTTEYSLTYIDCVSHELCIELSSVVAAKVEYESNPFLHTVLSGIFADLDNRDMSFIRALIRTKDGKTISCSRGLINPTCLLMTLID